MSAVFVAGETEAFALNGTVTEDTTAGTFDSSYARCSIKIATALSYADSPPFPGQTSFYFHGSVMLASMSSGQILGLLNTLGTEVFRISVSGSVAACVMQMQYLSSGVWTNIGSASAGQDLSTRKILDLKVDVNASGSAALYIGGSAIVTATGVNLAGLSEIAWIRLRSAGVTHWSEIAGSGASTIGRRVITCAPSGAGSDGEWTGDYSAVDETVYSASDYIETIEPNKTETFVHSGPSTSGMTIDAVSVCFNVLATAGYPSRVYPVLRSAGTNYLGTLGGAHSTAATSHKVWTQNPATNANWASTEIAALQFGAKSQV